MNNRRVFFPIIVAVVLLLTVYTVTYYHAEQIIMVGGLNTPVCGEFPSDIPPLDDFRTYPCLGRDSNLSPNVIPGGCVRTVCRPARKDLSPDTRCVILKQANTEICTYDPSKDSISGHLHETGEWEPHLIQAFIKTLQTNPEFVFLDIGCNIGVYTIAAAATRTRAICVDANPENLNHVAKSLSRGRLEKNVTIVWNALSDKRGLFNFQIVKGNFGASRIGDISKYGLQKKKDINVNAILLDDLEWLVRGKSLFMKVDAECYELFVLKGGYSFFENVDVRVIQMELREPETFDAVVDLLTTLGYSMFRDPLGSKPVARTDFKTKLWPGDVFFIKT